MLHARKHLPPDWMPEHAKPGTSDSAVCLDALNSLRANLGTTFFLFQGISIFLGEISSFSLGKIGIPWENVVPKLALNMTYFVSVVFFIQPTKHMLA
jgi:hypothetical protein